MKRLALILTLTLAGPCWSQSITLPPTLTVPKTGLVTIKPDKVDADAVAWVAVDDGLQLIDSALLKNDQTVVGIALQPGTYRVRACAARTVMGKAVLSPWSECLVTVGGVPPGPGPGPVPPTPVPTDPLVKAFQDAYAADADPAKATNLPLLAGLLANVVARGRATGQLKTDQDLRDYVRGATSLIIGDAALPAVRKAVGTYLNTKLPTDPVVLLTDATWATASKEYDAVAKALKGVR